MPRRTGWRVCSQPGCGEFTDQGGRCSDCRAKAEKKRGTARQRGYGREHERKFRPAVLARDSMCVLCRKAPSVHADHHPLSRRELVEKGLDPNDPQYGRGLCQQCHAKETAKAQPGGFNQ